MIEQSNIFQQLYQDFKITNHIRLIELFGGYGSQAMALRNIGANFERYKLIEFDKFAVDSYNAVHGTNFVPMDIRDVHAADLDIVERERDVHYVLQLSLYRYKFSW